ncbi:MAG TPA: cobaltochelatase subunit CobN [Ramlibacter sp.]|jgi:cobaltochelatase CobN|uniref:cobaltochelatase subunit CobN n=1 Tax=Ramlibacter sp. TaxID=1917967 RepID=UPI002D5EDA71|nr:cobaltochelatase subunit CobN [Ramlibacter sp.]HZY20738.1 cobaltochelatase subunit CobN [Ramlibacter sp.]
MRRFLDTCTARWRRLLRALLAVAGFAAGCPAIAASLLFVTTSPIAPGKFQMLAQAAQPHGIVVEARFVEKLARIDASLWEGHDMVFFDAPRDHIRDQIAARLAPAVPALARSGTPAVWLHAREPTWQHLPDELARQLHAYYVNGGPANSTNFFAAAGAYLGGRPWQSTAPPQVFPATGIYHPAAPGLVFAETAAYLDWKGGTAGRPVVAIAFHQQAVASAQTGFIDDLIARIEAAGAVPLAFYSPVMGKRDITDVLAPAGRTLANVLVNTQIMLNPEGRRAEFEALGIPVIQAMAYRQGDRDAWLRDPAGIALADVPFYLSQPEYAGVHDVMVAAATEGSEQLRAIAPQAQAVVAKALALARLQHQDRAHRKVAIMFWNYPPGEKNLGASFMNLPTSLQATLEALQAQGYRTEVPDAAMLTLQLQRLLRPYYRPARVAQELEELLRDGLADLLPLAEYRRWLADLPAPQRDAWLAHAGRPEQSVLLVTRAGRPHFVVPRLKLGNVVILPQPPRGEPTGGGLDARTKELYHSTSAAPPHSYMASYLWLRAGFRADALVHYGTHGTKEWLPGKERGLRVEDFPLLALGDLPVVYPYIVDNIGEATQTKRRGRAVNISHQTPAMAPAGLHRVLTQLHDDLHAWLAQVDGGVKERLQEQVIAAGLRERLDQDMGWSRDRIRADFPRFVQVLHDHLHELAETVQPLGLHTFGRGAGEEGRLYTVMMMLGRPFWEAAANAATGNPGEADEAIIADYTRMKDTAPYRLLRRHVMESGDAAGLPPALRAQLEQARRWYADLGAQGETRGLLAALDGRYVPTSYGGDPIKNADSLPTGRNLYGFDPSRVPTRAAWEAGKAALEQLVAAQQQKTGRAPSKLTFTLWSVETMRHQGLLEAQALWALGVEPVWDAGGRVTGVQLVPRATLGRPRIDVVLSATGLYRDHFPNVMRQLARAAQLASEATDEPDNAVAQHAVSIAQRLVAQGWRAEAARSAAQTRIFASASGSYGSGLDDAALATDTWKTMEEGDRQLAQLYLRKMQFAYGPAEADWGKSGADLARDAGSTQAEPGFNLYATHLRGTEAAVLARTSNLYGMLTTDDPFQYLGGIATAVRHLDGKAPELFISNLRGPGAGKAEAAGQFLARELATRNLHPGHIEGLMKEGYAGTLQVLDGINNFTGWTTVAREVVRDDQWQAFVDVYVRDRHGIGVRRWMERENPHALAQVMERMLEMARQGYWQADPATVRELKEGYRALARRHDVRTDNTTFQRYVGLSGHGLARPAAAAAATPAPTPSRAAAPPPAAAAAPPPEPPAPPPRVRGMQLEQVVQQPAVGTLFAAAMGLLLLAPLAGAARQWRRSA